jgi:polyisoprenoid-binding protein YceI
MSSIADTKVPTGTWNLDPVHSTVGFEVDYMAGTFRGQFRDAQVRLALDDSGARIEGSAEVASVDVKDENLAAHLQSPDFFDAERFPTLTFVAEDIDLNGDAVTVPGEITIKGVTKPVRVAGTITDPMNDAYGTERLGLKLSASLDRTDFGLNWNTPLPSGDPALADEVTIVAELQLVKAP